MTVQRTRNVENGVVSGDEHGSSSGATERERQVAMAGIHYLARGIFPLQSVCYVSSHEFRMVPRVNSLLTQLGASFFVEKILEG